MDVVVVIFPGEDRFDLRAGQLDAILRRSSLAV